MNYIEKSIMRIKNKVGSFWVPLCTFIATVVYTFLANHIISIFNTGYLSYFRIYVNYPIESVLSHSNMMLFIFITIIISIVTIITILLNHFLLKSKLKSIFSWKSLINLVLFFCILFIILFLLFAVMFAYIFQTNNIIPLYISLKIIVMQLDFWKIILFLNIYIVLSTFLLFAINLKIESINDNIKNNVFNFERKIKNHVILLLYFSILCLGIFVLDSTSLGLGKINASIEPSYPSFTEDGTEYLVLAKSHDINFLILNIDSLHEEKVTYMIKNIEGYTLTSKLNSELNLD